MDLTDVDPVDPSKFLIGLVSLGCPKNVVDGEAMLGLLRERGYALTADADLADVIIVNTCGFTESAKKESIDAILEMADKKTGSRCRALIVTGCLSERYRESFKTELPEVDAILGTGEYGRICEIVDAIYGVASAVAGSADANKLPADFKKALAGFWKSGRTVRESTAGQRLGHLNAPRVLTNGTGSVYIKIAEGCVNNCMYCAIPEIRGPYVSRPYADIMAEAARVPGGREYETVLIAQDTTMYGQDANGQDASGLCGLIAGLSGIERVRWIRLMYAYPSRVGDRLIEMFEKDNKLLRYLDMPVQHASDRILRAMGRRYDSSLLAALVEKLRRRVPGIALRTTVITGFPGETDADYGELYDFLEWAKFERLGVFAYSREEGTPAARMRGQVAKDVAEKRRAGLLRLQASVMARYESGRIGREYDAIVERSYIKPGERIVRFKARTYAEAPEIDGNISGRADPAQISGGAILAPGSFIRMKITGKNANGLIGALVL